MSSSGQGDQIDETSKDDDSEISSTTPDNGQGKLNKEDVSGITKIDSEVVPILAVDTPDTSESVDATPAILSTEGVDDVNVVSTTVGSLTDANKTESIMEAKIGVPTSTVNVTNSNIPELVEAKEPKLCHIEKNSVILADADKDSGSEEFKLRGKGDGDDNVDETSTADVLKKLDQIICNFEKGPEDEYKTEISIEKQESVTKKNYGELNEQLNSTVSDKTAQDFESSVHKNDNQDVKVTISDDSNKDELDIEKTLPFSGENSKILACDNVEVIGNTSLDKPVELENPMDISSSENVEKPKTCDQVEILTKAFSDQDIFRDYDVMENPCKNTMKIESEQIAESTSQDVEINVDTEMISKESKIDKNLTEKIQNKEVFNEDIKQEISEISKEVTHLIDDTDHNNKMEVSNTNMAENIDTEDTITPCDNPHVNLPIHVSNISDTVNTSKITSKDLDEITSEVSEKEREVSQDANNMKIDSEFDDNEHPNIDENISQITEDSFLDTTITPNVHHRINKPNVMLDIPTQELSDIEAELDDDDLEQYDKVVDNEKIQESLENLSEIDIKELKHQITPDNITSKSESMDIDRSTVDIVTKLSKVSVSPTKSSFIQDQPSTSKLLQHDDKSSASILEQEHNDGITLKSAHKMTDEEQSKLSQEIDEKSSTHEIYNKKAISLKSTQEIDSEKSSTSKTLQEINDDKPSISKTSFEIDDEKPSTSKSTPKIDDDIPSTSKTSFEIDDEKPSTSKSTQKVDDEKPSTTKSTQEIDDEKPSTTKSTQEIDNEKPSTSKTSFAIDDEKPSTSKSILSSETLTADITDNAEELTDSLGLLAESSRVMDDENDDDEDPEVDDNDDDDDFDLDEETNSEMAEDMEESSTPPPDLDPKLDKVEPSPKVQEEQESEEGTMDIAEGSIDIVDDVECEENDLLEMDIPDDADVVLETPLTEKTQGKDEPEIIDADTHVEKKKTPPEKVVTILESILGGSKKVKESNVRTFVDLDESSDSDDVLEVSKSDASKDNVVSVNIPKGVEVMSTSGPCSTSEIVSKEGEVIISGVPKPPPQKMSKINTSEVSIKTTLPTSKSSMHIPETTSSVKTKTNKDEIFNLDSDEEVDEKKASPTEIDDTAAKDPENLAEMKCINPECTNEAGTYYQSDRATCAYYSLTRRSAVVCEQCRQRAMERNEALINGIKDLRPFLELEMDAPSQQLVEISDSDSDGEVVDETSYVGEKDARFIEENLIEMLNETWVKYKMESRLQDTETYLMNELEKIEADAKEINAMLDECQKKTDTIRLDFYKDYEPRRKALGGIVIHDTPFSSYSHLERDIEGINIEPEISVETFGNRYPKRRASSIAAETPAKRPAIPMGYAPLEGDAQVSQPDDKVKPDDDKEDISVVKVSVDAAPADLPPCGDINRPPLKIGMIIYAMRNAFGTWLKGRVMDVLPKVAGFTQCRVKFEHKIKNPCKVLAARCLAYPDPSEVRMTIGTRVVALFKDPHNTARRESFYSGVVAEIPNPVNSYRYLVFFDDGYAQYVRHQDTRIVCESSNLVWDEVHPFIRDFIHNYLVSYPERPMVRLHAGEKLKTEWNGKWWDSNVLRVDASIALIHFDEDNRTEWIYRGSTRLAPLYLELQAAEKAGVGRTRSRAPRSKAQMRANMPCVEYTRSDEVPRVSVVDTQAIRQQKEELRRQRAVAKKSTTSMAAQAEGVVVITPKEGTISRVVYYTPKNAVKPYKMSPHTCSLKCRRSDLLSLKELRTYNPLSKPLLSGWERQTVRYKYHRIVFYRAPCGRRLRDIAELHKYLNIIQSDLSVDLFDFTPGTHCLSEFVLSKCIVSKKDLSHGKENVPVPCVNYYDDSLPEFCSYNTERTPTAGVPLNLDPEFLCGCDCTDDCADKSKCACWKMTLEGARTIGQDGPNVGYEYRRLPEPLPSGIYECNSRCKCKQTCLNRVAQHPLQLKLQVFKTINRGWGIRALNDIPKGAFVCVYAGNLLTDATANLDGLNEGDEYLAELDYIEVVEGMKEGYETDVPEEDKKLDKKGVSDDSDSISTSESEAEDATKKDGDFQPGYILNSEFLVKKSLRKREKAKKKEEEKQIEAAKKNDCITISDDEEVREPSRFTAQAGMVDRDLITKHSSRVSVRTLYGKDEACYIMDAKVQGNIGRYLNHSCHPNVFVQNVFVDTHDPRFPWVAFFALSLVRAGTELTWNYNYDIGSVPEKVLYCYCGAPNCRGRLL